MYVFQSFHLKLVVIHDLDTFGIALTPLGCDPPLVVDPDGVEFLEVAFEFFQPVGGWRHKIVE